MWSILLFAGVFTYSVFGQALEYRWLEHYDNGWGYSYDDRQQSWLEEQDKKISSYHANISQDAIAEAFEALYLEQKILQEQSLPDGRIIRRVLEPRAESFSIYIDDEKLYNSSAYHDELSFERNIPVSFAVSPNNKYLTVEMSERGSTVSGNLIVYKLDSPVSLVRGIEDVYFHGVHWVGENKLGVATTKFKSPSEELVYDFKS